MKQTFTSPAAYLKVAMKDNLKQIQSLTDGCRVDMHEPDNEGLEVRMRGTHLDNAMGDEPATNCGEFTVGFCRNGKVEWMNLANIIALARLAVIEEERPTTEEWAKNLIKEIESKYLKDARNLATKLP